MTQTRVKGDNWSSVETADLRLYQTRITWLRSLSAILPLFWHHDMANFLTFPAKNWEVLLWRHEIHDVFPRNWANALQNAQFFR